MGKLPGWGVAGAIMIYRNEPQHYVLLATMVIETELSTLASRGGITPENTLRRDMADRPELFSTSDRTGYYDIVDAAMAVRIPEILAALYTFNYKKAERHDKLMKNMLCGAGRSREEIEELKQLQEHLNRMLGLIVPAFLTCDAST